MTRKKILAALTALCCTASMSAMPASAMYTDYSITERDFSEYDERGTIHVTDYGTFNGIVVETDGTALTEEMVNELQGYVEFNPWENVPKPQGACNWVEYSAIPGDSAYMISLDLEDSAQREIVGRQFMVEHDFVEAVYIVDYVSETWAQWVNAGFDVHVKEGIVPDQTTIPELAEFSFIHAYENVYSYSLQDIEASAFNANLTGKTEYEQLQFGLQFAEEIEEKYSDILLSVSPAVITPDSSTPSELSAVSIWNSAGDLDADGEINASDAAELLVLSAMKGATADGSGYDPFTTVQKSAADLNGDTFCDANDAAYILQFAAEAGAGSELSIGEFMTR